MTSNRKAKTAARALAAETGRSYTHARRVDSGPAAVESAGFPRFPADAALAVDTANGAEPWDGARWNAYATACERYGELFAVRLLAIIHPGTEPGAPVVDDDAPLGGCDECGLPDDECGCAGQRTYRLT